VPGLLVVSAAGWFWNQKNSTSLSLSGQVVWHEVDRCDLKVVVLERGSLESQSNIDLLCEVEDVRKDNINGTTIQWMVPNDSETRLSVALDTPLNRRLQRNNFRLALINYNVGLRNLMAAEDSIKLDVREDLRQLALDRSQYTIAVESAALAYERVISTRLRLQFAVANVAARVFLEAQQAYTNALNSIARLHVNYITDRTELFFDLEAFDLDSNGYWSGVTEDLSGKGIFSNDRENQTYQVA